jgi:ABC-type amino acid transport substrate-binding protein
MPPLLSRRRLAALPLLAAGPALAAPDGSLSRVRDAGVIRLGVQAEGTVAATRAPDGSFRGYLPELGRRIATGLGVQPEFVPVPRGDMLGLLLQGAFELGLGGAIASTWLALTALPTTPLMQFQLVVLTPRDLIVSGMAELSGLRVGVLDGRSFAEALHEAGLEQERTVIHARWEEAAEALLRGREDAVIVPGHHAREIQRVAPQATARFTLGEFWHCGVVRMGEHDLLRAIDVLLHLLRHEGQLSMLHRAFFDRDMRSGRTL